jgi:hypothetical protein
MNICFGGCNFTRRSIKKIYGVAYAKIWITLEILHNFWGYQKIFIILNFYMILKIFSNILGKDSGSVS